jgi:DnaJ-class molecular chaperone
VSRILYDRLGVASTASDAEIKSAYRKLAKKYHPDSRPGDKAAEEKFKQISAAWHILGDPAQRRRYDAGEIDEEGRERAAAGFGPGGFGAGGFGGGRNAGFSGFETHFDGRNGGFGGGFADLFEEILGGRGPRAGGFSDMGGAGMGGGVPDTEARITVSFTEAALGATRRISLSGAGELDLKIPAGATDGTKLRLRGKGQGGGDLIVRLEVAPHPTFRREGDDIHLDLPVTLAEAVLGAKVEVPTLDGHARITVPSGSSSGRKLRLKGKGVPARGGTGDLYVHLKIVLPDHPDPALQAAIKAWAEAHPQPDPRRNLKG